MKRLLLAVNIVFLTACTTLQGVNPEFKGVVDPTYPLVDISGQPFCTATKIDAHRFLTAAHCVQNPTRGMILGKDGVLYSFGVAKEDAEADLALITSKAPGPVARVTFLEPDRYTKVVSAGYPYGIAMYITEGHWIGDSWWPTLAKHSHTSTPVAGGNSGGGIFVYQDGWRLLAVVQMRANDSPHICIVSKPSVLKEFLK